MLRLPDQHLVWSVARLNDSPWNTAFSTGAVGHGVRRSAALLAALRVAAIIQPQHGPLPGIAARHVRISDACEPARQIVGDGIRGRKRALAAEMVTGQFRREIGEALKGSYSKIQAEGD